MRQAEISAGQWILHKDMIKTTSLGPNGVDIAASSGRCFVTKYETTDDTVFTLVWCARALLGEDAVQNGTDNPYVALGGPLGNAAFETLRLLDSFLNVGHRILERKLSEDWYEFGLTGAQ